MGNDGQHEEVFFRLDKIDQEGLSNSRTGMLMNSIPTPAYFAPTVAGNLHHLLPDLAAQISELQGLWLNFADFVDLPGNHLSLREWTAQTTKSRKLCLSPSNPSHFFTSTCSKGKVIDTHNGRKTISVTKYAEHVRALKPDLVVALADEIDSTLGKNRQMQSVSTTLTWLEEFIQIQQKLDSHVPVIAVLVGGSSLFYRRKCIDGILSLAPHFSGMQISGLGLAENSLERQEILEMIHQEIPPTCVKILDGFFTPWEILLAIEQGGVDGFTTTYPLTLTEAGLAFSCPPTSESYKLNLRDPEWKCFRGPVSSTCGCWTCLQGYSRAYIHHLLQVHEMLAQVLLYVHNLTQMGEFFKSVRHHIDLETLGQYKAQWKALLEKY